MENNIGQFIFFDNKIAGRVLDCITVTKNYQINFPLAFYNINCLHGKKSALLYFDKATMMIAIEFTDNYDDRGFKISMSNRGKGGGYITAKKFFVMAGLVNKIEFGRYKYEHKMITKGSCKKDFFVIQLKHKRPITVTVQSV